MKLIDSDALEHELITKRRYLDKGQVLDVAYIINKAPAIDAVLVCRCKDCKHITPVEGGLPLCALHNIACAYNGFCSCGERKEGNDADNHD